jgi:lysozyme
MQTSAKGIAFIKRHEGFRPKAYTCAAGVWTIGYGHTAGVRPGDEVTQAEADDYLAADLARYEAAVRAAGIPSLTQGQFDALVSLCYNIGAAAFGSSTLLKRAKANPNDPAIRDGFMRFVYAGKRPLAGLRKRRSEEADMYFSAAQKNAKCATQSA